MLCDRLGHRVMYQPLAVVTHFEGVSHGTDTGVGIKSYQVTNQRRFADKWQQVLYGIVQMALSQCWSATVVRVLVFCG